MKSEGYKTDTLLLLFLVQPKGTNGNLDLTCNFLSRAASVWFPCLACLAFQYCFWAEYRFMGQTLKRQSTTDQQTHTVTKATGVSEMFLTAQYWNLGIPKYKEHVKIIYPIYQSTPNFIQNILFKQLDCQSTSFINWGFLKETIASVIDKEIKPCNHNMVRPFLIIMGVCSRCQNVNRMRLMTCVA